MFLDWIIKKLFSSRNKRVVNKLWPLVHRVNNLMLVQDDSAHDLDIKGHHVPLQAVACHLDKVFLLVGGVLQAAARLLHHGIRLAEDVVGGLAIPEPLLELGGLGLELLVAQALVGRTCSLSP